MDSVVQWLLEDKNPAVQYRTRMELLHEDTDKSAAAAFIGKKLPADWQNTKGLWYTYWLTAIAECGLQHADVPMDADRAVRLCADGFANGCTDFMHLRALVMLGLGEHPIVQHTIDNLQALPDGGFLCDMKLKKRKDIPKSCAKANIHALLFCAEAKKKNIALPITDPLLEYFWAHRIFYRLSAPDVLMLDGREGWRAVDTFHPMETMRIGLHNIVEAFCALGYGKDERLAHAWALLDAKTMEDGKVPLDGTLTKSYLPKETVGKPSKWVTFYTLLAKNARALYTQTR